MQQQLRQAYLLSLAQKAESNHAAKSGKQTESNGCSLCSDLVTLAVWGAMVPAVLWLGAAAGF